MRKKFKLIQEKRFEKNIGKSLTVPNQATDISSLVVRLTQGEKPNVSHRVYYDGNENELNIDLVDVTLDGNFDLVDLTEGLEVIEENRKKLSELEKAAKDEREKLAKAKEELELKNKLKAEIEAELQKEKPKESKKE